VRHEEAGQGSSAEIPQKNYETLWKSSSRGDGKCPSYLAAMKVIGNEGREETGRHLNNRAENSHLPFRRRERAMSRFRRMRSLQKFASMQSSVHNHFNHQSNIEKRAGFKLLRDAALREWRELLVV
jgi:putative transposase